MSNDQDASTKAWIADVVAITSQLVAFLHDKPHGAKLCALLQAYRQLVLSDLNFLQISTRMCADLSGELSRLTSVMQAASPAPEASEKPVVH